MHKNNRLFVVFKDSIVWWVIFLIAFSLITFLQKLFLNSADSGLTETRHLQEHQVNLNARKTER